MVVLYVDACEGEGDGECECEGRLFILSLTGNERKGLSCSGPSAILFQNFAFSLFFSFFFSFRGWGNELGTIGRGLSCFLAMKDTTYKVREKVSEDALD